MPDLGLGSWPHRRARMNPGAPALRQNGRTVSYRELADAVDHLARFLAVQGVGRGDRVAYLGANDVAAFETLFASGRLGAIFVPMNTRLAPAELARLVDDCAPAVLIHGAEQTATVAGLRQGAPGVRAWIAAADLGQLVVGADPLPDVDVALDDDAVILYTSGTSGTPKGVVLTHGNLTFNTMNQLAHVDVSGRDTALCIAPIFHATGLGQVSLPTLFKGGCVVVLPRFDPGLVLSTVAELGIVSFSAVPTMLQMLCDHPDFAATDLSSLRYVIYGGSMVAARVAEAWQRRGVEILQGYGMTEAAPGVFMATVDGARQRPVSVGVPHFFTDVDVVPLGTGAGATTGELRVRGPNVFRGYWNRPAETEEALADGWFSSGDVVRVDDDGWAYVVDRIKNMIISGGENVYPAEVESVLNELPGIVDSAVVAVPDDRWGEVGMAFLVTTAGTTWTPEKLRAALVDRLAAFKIPKYVRVVDDLPRTATGKIRRQDLPRRASER